MGESFQGLRAVARVAIMNQAGELLLSRSRDGRAWVPPGGTLDEGETLVLAAAREALEEAGVTVAVGPLVYLQEFRPKHRREHVMEACFRAAPAQDRPDEAVIAAGRVRPLGAPDRPWAAWSIQDLDGPVREVRWFSREALAALTEPVYPAFLRDGFWTAGASQNDPYLGLVEAR